MRFYLSQCSSGATCEVDAEIVSLVERSNKRTEYIRYPFTGICFGILSWMKTALENV